MPRAMREARFFWKIPRYTISQIRAAIRSSAPRLGSGRLRSEEHTSELQSQSNLVCRLLLEKKNSARYAYDFVEKVPLVKAAAFQVTLDEAAQKNPKAKQAKPEQFFDNSLVQELVNAGFFVSLWGKNP